MLMVGHARCALPAPPAARRGIVRCLAAGLALLVAAPALAQDVTLLVADKGADAVSMIALEGGKEVARIPTGDAPHEIAVSPDGKTAAVAAYGGSAIGLIDIAARKKIKTIALAPGSKPHGLVWIDGDRLAVTMEGAKAVAIVSRDGTVRTIPTGQDGTHMIVVAPDGHTAYTANRGSGTVSVLDLDRGVKLRDIKVLGKPEGLALAQGGRELWVGDQTEPRVEVIDVASGEVLRRFAVGDGGDGLAIARPAK
jgi:YVTN family beta-propeller protein